MSKYMSEENTKVEYNHDNWVKYASAVKTKLDPVKGGSKMRIKAVYDLKGYVTLPNYVPFIEPMAIPASDSKLVILSSDRKERATGDVEVKTSNPFDTLTTTPTTFQVEAPKGNDLPF
jgi:hypothetical protein